MYAAAAVALGGGAYYFMGRSSSNKVEGKAKELKGRAEGAVSLSNYVQHPASAMWTVQRLLHRR